jgi:uncharacterized protein (DUF433 family)
MSATRIEDLVSRLEAVDGEVRIAGTNVPVRDVFIWNVVDGESAGDIVYRHPELTPDDVEAAIICGWVNRAHYRSELNGAGIDVSSHLIRPSDRSSRGVGLVGIVLAVVIVCATTWAKIEFVNAGNVPNVNFLEWLIERWGISGAVVVFALWLCTQYLLKWYVPWSTKLLRKGFPMLGACAVAIALAFGFCTLHLFTLWRTGQPLWDRQTWETRAVMVPMSLVFGVLVGGSIVKVGKCQRAFSFRSHGDPSRISNGRAGRSAQETRLTRGLTHPARLNQMIG